MSCGRTAAAVLLAQHSLGCVPASPPRCPELLQVRERRHREVQELVGLPQQEAAELRFQRRVLS